MATGGSLIGALRVTLGLDTAQFEAGTKRARDIAKRDVSDIQKTLNLLKTGVAALVTGATATALVDVAKRALDYASSLGEVAQQLGVTTKELQTYRYAASQVGVSTEQMDAALARLTRTQGEALAGSKPQVQVFRDLGVSLRDANGNILSAGQLIPKLADALSKIKDPATRARYEVDLFGKAGQKLDTLLAGGSKAVNELTSAAEKLGVVLSDEQIQKADETADKLAALKQVLEARIAGVVADNANAISFFANAIADLGDKALKTAGNLANMYRVSKLDAGVPKNEQEAAAREILSSASGRDYLRKDRTARLALLRNPRTGALPDTEEARRYQSDLRAIERMEALDKRRAALANKPVSSGALPTFSGGGGKTSRVKPKKGSTGDPQADALRIQAEEAEELSRVLADLFPEDVKANEFARNVTLINNAMGEAIQRGDAQAIDKLAEANKRLAESMTDDLWKSVDVPPLKMIEMDMAKNLPELGSAFERFATNFAESARKTAEAARDIRYSLDSLVYDIKSGDWLSVLADVADALAKIMTPTSQGGWGLGQAISSIGSIFGGGGGGFGSSATSFRMAPLSAGNPLAGLPGFANGGSFNVGGIPGVDRNILSINGIPRARVSANENVSVSNGGRQVVEVHIVENEMFASRVQTISTGSAVKVVRTAGTAAAKQQSQALA